jgi:phage RecT family recombinase
MPADPQSLAAPPAPASARDLATLALPEALERFTPELEIALPDHIPVERFKRVVLTAINSSTPQNNLAGADRRSLFTACVRCAQDGLYPDGREAALVVFNTRHKDANGQEYWAPLVQYLPMIQGIRKRMRNTGEVRSAVAEVVYQNDLFRRRLGDNPGIEHEPPSFTEERGPPVGAYAIIKLYNGETLYDTMNVHEIERTRALSRAKDSLGWKSFWGEMARKTVLRRCAKQAPTGSDLDRLLRRDDEPPEIPAIADMRKVEPRPKIADYSETGEAKSGSPRRSRASKRVAGERPIAEAAGNGAAGAATTSPATKWFFADEVGEVFEFEEVTDAVTSYEQRLEGARGNRQLLEARWDNGARLIYDLRGRGHGNVASALATQYAYLLAEIDAAEIDAADETAVATTAAAVEVAEAAAEAAAEAGLIGPQDDPRVSEKELSAAKAARQVEREQDQIKRQAENAAYDVLVPLPEGMAMAAWYKPANERINKMSAAQCPAADFDRFLEVNKAALSQLEGGYNGWWKLLTGHVAKARAGAPT